MADPNLNDDDETETESDTSSSESLDFETRVRRRLLQDVNQLLATVPNYRPNHTDLRGMKSLATLDEMDARSQTYANVVLPYTVGYDENSIWGSNSSASNDENREDQPSANSPTSIFSNNPSTSISSSLGIYNLNIQNELENFPPRDNTTINFIENIVRLNFPSVYDEYGVLLNEFIEYRKIVLNALILQGKVRIFSPRTEDRQEPQRLTLNDLLLTNSNVPDFYIGGIPVEWIGSYNSEFISNVDISSPSNIHESIQPTEAEDWFRCLNVLRDSTGATSFQRFEHIRQYNFFAGTSSSHSVLVQELNGQAHALPEWIRIDEENIPSMNLLDNDNQLNETTGLSRQVSSPFSLTKLTIENFFENICTPDSASLVGGTTNISEENEEQNNDSSITSSIMEDISLGAQQTVLTHISTDLTDSLGDITVVQTMELDITDTMDEENEATNSAYSDENTTPLP